MQSECVIVIIWVTLIRRKYVLLPLVLQATRLPFLDEKLNMFIFFFFFHILA